MGKFKKEFQKGKVHPSFKDKTWDVKLANTQLISKCNKAIWFLSRIIDILLDMCGLYLWKEINVSQLLMSFKTILYESGHNWSMILYLKDKDRENYSAHNGGKSFVTERFIRA